MPTKSNLGDKLLDLIIVILGISIAFSLNKYQEVRKQTQMTEFYVANMIQELNEDSLGLVYAIQDCDADLKYMEMVDSLYKVKHPNVLDSLALLVIKVNNFHHYRINATSFNSIMTTGNVSLIRDLDLKTAMVNYYEYQGQVDFGESVFWEYLDDLNDFLNDKLIFGEARFTDEKILGYTAMQNNIMKMASSIGQKKRIYLIAQRRRDKLKDQISSWVAN